jgi:hypothetical protein
MNKDVEFKKFKTQNLLREYKLESAWDIYEQAQSLYEQQRGLEIQREERTIYDILLTIIRQGRMSDKQAGYIRKLQDRISTRAERQAQYDAERAKAENCPRGRVELTGDVLKVKEQVSKFGLVWKVLIKTNKGFLVWGTLPQSISQADRGSRVSLIANVTPSDKDEKFGFYSRPTKATILNN